MKLVISHYTDFWWFEIRERFKSNIKLHRDQDSICTLKVHTSDSCRVGALTGQYRSKDFVRYCYHDLHLNSFWSENTRWRDVSSNICRKTLTIWNKTHTVMINNYRYVDANSNQFLYFQCSSILCRNFTVYCSRRSDHQYFYSYVFRFVSRTI